MPFPFIRGALLKLIRALGRGWGSSQFPEAEALKRVEKASPRILSELGQLGGAALSDPCKRENTHL